MVRARCLALDKFTPILKTRIELEKKKDISKEKAEKAAKAQQEEEKSDSAKQKTKNEDVKKKNKEEVGVTAADLQAKEISAGRSGKKRILQLQIMKSAQS